MYIPEQIDTLRLRTSFSADPDFKLIRLDRALLYAKKQLQNHIQYLTARDTKSVGEYAYQLYRFGREMASFFSMGGDRTLAEKIFTSVRSLNTRTLRLDAIKQLRHLSELLDSYEIAESVDAADIANAALPSIPPGSNQPPTPVDVSGDRVVFIIMPFSAEFNDVWKGAIEKAATELGLKPIRVDMINRSSNITDDIVESIRKCHLAIIDVSDNNPNVMFELGYTLALNKPNIIISQSANFLPFDIRNIRTIVYTNSWSGIEELRTKLKEFLKAQQPKGSKAKRFKK